MSISEKAEKLESKAEGLQGTDILSFAPKPWRSAEFGLTPVEGPTYYRITDSNGVPIAMTYGWSRQDWLVGLAIAAVPDLVEALTEAVKGKVVQNWLTGGERVCLVCGQLPESGEHDEACWVPRGEAALAKAWGETE